MARPGATNSEDPWCLGVLMDSGLFELLGGKDKGNLRLLCKAVCEHSYSAMRQLVFRPAEMDPTDQDRIHTLKCLRQKLPRLCSLKLLMTLEAEPFATSSSGALGMAGVTGVPTRTGLDAAKAIFPVLADESGDMPWITEFCVVYTCPSTCLVQAASAHKVVKLLMRSIPNLQQIQICHSCPTRLPAFAYIAPFGCPPELGQLKQAEVDDTPDPASLEMLHKRAPNLQALTLAGVELKGRYITGLPPDCFKQLHTLSFRPRRARQPNLPSCSSSSSTGAPSPAATASSAKATAQSSALAAWHPSVWSDVHAVPWSSCIHSFQTLRSLTGGHIVMECSRRMTEDQVVLDFQPDIYRYTSHPVSAAYCQGLLDVLTRLGAGPDRLESQQQSPSSSRVLPGNNAIDSGNGSGSSSNSSGSSTWALELGMHLNHFAFLFPAAIPEAVQAATALAPAPAPYPHTSTCASGSGVPASLAASSTDRSITGLACVQNLVLSDPDLLQPCPSPDGLFPAAAAYLGPCNAASGPLDLSSCVYGGVPWLNIAAAMPHVTTLLVCCGDSHQAQQVAAIAGSFPYLCNLYVFSRFSGRKYMLNRSTWAQDIARAWTAGVGVVPQPQSQQQSLPSPHVLYMSGLSVEARAACNSALAAAGVQGVRVDTWTCAQQDRDLAGSAVGTQHAAGDLQA